MTIRARRRAARAALAELDAAATLEALEARVAALEKLGRRVEVLEARMPMTIVERRRAYRGRNTP